jgi:Zn-dependent metalloprotease
MRRLAICAAGGPSALFFLIFFFFSHAVSPSENDFKLLSQEEYAIGISRIYQQFYSGIPVEGSKRRVFSDHIGRVISVHEKRKSIQLTGEIRTDTLDFALKTTKRKFPNAAEVENEGMVILAGEESASPAWKITVDDSLANGSWLLYVDANHPNVVLRAFKTAIPFEGQANIWKENPVTTQRTNEILTHLDASKELSGNFVRVYDANSAFDVDSPIHVSDYTRAKETDRVYNYPEGDPRLTEAMAYYHIDQVHERWRSLGFHKLDTRVPVFVNVAAFDGGPGYDNAHYARNRKFKRTGIYVFGASQEFGNAGLDAEVLYHEYGHGVLDHVRPDFLESAESVYTFAFHEAFGDISASALSGDAKLFDFAQRDVVTKKYSGRNMINKKRFPRDVVLRSVHFSEPHYTCLILDGAWWDLQKQIGALPAQNLLYSSLSLLPETINFFDIKEGMIEADRLLNQGRNGTVIENSFARHGLGGKDPGQTGTLQVNGVLSAMEQQTGYVPATTFTRSQNRVDYCGLQRCIADSRLLSSCGAASFRFACRDRCHSVPLDTGSEKRKSFRRRWPFLSGNRYGSEHYTRKLLDSFQAKARRNC